MSPSESQKGLQCLRLENLQFAEIHSVLRYEGVPRDHRLSSSEEKRPPSQKSSDRTFFYGALLNVRHNRDGNECRILRAVIIYMLYKACELDR